MKTLLQDTRDVLEGFADVRTERMSNDKLLKIFPCYEAHRAKSSEVYKLLKQGIPADLLPTLVEYSNAQSDMEIDVGNISYCKGLFDGLTICQLLNLKC